MTYEDREDLIQEAWAKALSRTTFRPQAYTPQELAENYAHITPLVKFIFRHEKIRTFKQPKTVPLTNDIPVVYTTEDGLDGCTPQQLEAIRYFVSVIDQDRPLTTAERMKLSRYRKQTGLALTVPRYKEHE